MREARRTWWMEKGHNNELTKTKVMIVAINSIIVLSYKYCATVKFSEGELPGCRWHQFTFRMWTSTADSSPTHGAITNPRLIVSKKNNFNIVDEGAQVGGFQLLIVQGKTARKSGGDGFRLPRKHRSRQIRQAPLKRLVRNRILPPTRARFPAVLAWTLSLSSLSPSPMSEFLRFTSSISVLVPSLLLSPLLPPPEGSSISPPLLAESVVILPPSLKLLQKLLRLM